MIEEKDLVPCETSDLPNGDWIVFAPHHDDETIGMGGSLILAKEQNIKVTLVIVTDGSQAGDRDTREKESQKVAQKLGIKEVIFLRESDRNIIINNDLVKSVAQIIDKSNANSVFFPSPMELHPDHRMTTELVWNALRQVKIKPNSYAYEITVQNQVNYLVDITNTISRKKSLLSLYTSQLEQNDYLDFIVSMNRLRTYTLKKDIKYAEGFYNYGNNYKEDYRIQLMSSIEPYTQKQYIEKKIDNTIALEICLSPKNISDNMDENLVSVIIPCFNDGQYIIEAINSVLNQTYKNIEIIIVNDASTEKPTIDILNKLQENGLKVINLKINSGPSVARNRSISEAKGKYILPLDADDKIEPTYIEKAVNILESNIDIGIVYCEAKYFGLKTGKWDLPEYSFEKILISNMIFATAMYRRIDWENVGGYNKNMIYGYEDHDLWLSVLELNRQVYMIPETLFSYRIKEVSRTTKLISNDVNIVNTNVQIFNNHKQLYTDNIKVIFDELYERELAYHHIDQELRSYIKNSEDTQESQEYTIQEQALRMKELGNTIESQEHTIKEQSLYRKNLESTRASQEHTIQEQAMRMKELGNTIESQEQTIQEQELRMKNLATIIETQEQTIQNENIKFNALHLEKSEIIESLKDELVLIYTSRSWKVIRFFKKLKKYLT